MKPSHSLPLLPRQPGSFSRISGPSQPWACTQHLPRSRSPQRCSRSPSSMGISEISPDLSHNFQLVAAVVLSRLSTYSHASHERRVEAANRFPANRERCSAVVPCPQLSRGRRNFPWEPEANARTTQVFCEKLDEEFILTLRFRSPVTLIFTAGVRRERVLQMPIRLWWMLVVGSERYTSPSVVGVGLTASSGARYLPGM